QQVIGRAPLLRRERRILRLEQLTNLRFAQHARGVITVSSAPVRKIVIRSAGGYDRLTLETQPDPRPGRDDVLVRTLAIGVNYADCIVRMGLYESAKKYVGWPITPGFEVAGVVEAIGESVTDLEVGARVFALTRFGGYATHVVVPRHQV